MSRITRRSLRSTALALVLPALLLRALIPVGFMPTAGSSAGVEIALCPSVIDAASYQSQAANPHEHHGQHGDRSAHRTQPCPYALSATALPTVAAAVVTPQSAVVEVARSAHPEPVFLPTIARLQWPRGPPFAS